MAAATVLPPLARRWHFSDHTIHAGRTAVVAGIVAGLAFLVSASITASRFPAGDEPHYLIIAQSLIQDHDLRVENNYRRGDQLAYYPGALKPDYLRRGADGEIYSIHAPGLPFLIAPVFASSAGAASRSRPWSRRRPRWRARPAGDGGRRELVCGPRPPSSPFLHAFAVYLTPSGRLPAFFRR